MNALTDAHGHNNPAALDGFGRTNQCRYGVLFLFVSLVLVHIMPPLPNSSWGALTTAIRYLVPFAFAFLLIMNSSGLPRIFLSSLLIVAFLFLSLTVSALFLDSHQTVLADFYELAKPIWIPTVVGASFLIFYRGSANAATLYAAFNFLLFCCLFYSLAETFGFLGFDVAELYVREKGVLQGKAVFSFSSTYFASAIYLFLTAIFATRLITQPAIYNGLLTVIGLYLVISTQSRSGFLALCIVCVFTIVFFLIHNWRTRGSLRKIGAVLSVVTIACLAPLWMPTIIGLLSDHFPYMYGGLEGQLGPWLHGERRDSGSLAVRLRQIEWAISHNSIVFSGQGIGKGYAHLLESWYALYYYRYGVLGVSLYFLIWAGAAYAAYRSYRISKAFDKDTSAFCFGFVIFTASLPVISFSSLITQQPHLYSFFYVSLGAVFGIYFRFNKQ